MESLCFGLVTSFPILQQMYVKEKSRFAFNLQMCVERKKESCKLLLDIECGYLQYAFAER